MIYNNIEGLRKILYEELKAVDPATPIKLPYEKDLLQQLLFENGRIYDKYPILDRIDFSEIDFSGIDITNFDFTGLHGVKINPQTIKNKDLGFTICNGVEFIGPFDEVRIKETDFTGSKGAVINPRKIFADYKGVKFADVTFDGCFVGVKIAGADFTGSKGAVIDLQSIQDKDISYTKLSGVILKGGFNNVCVIGTDFTGVLGIKKLFKYEKGVKLNPQEIRGNNLSDAICNGVEFTGSFEGVKIAGTDFTGSKGAVIELKNSYAYDYIDLRNTKLSGVRFEGIIIDAKVQGTDFTGSINAKIDPVRTYDQDMRKTICNGVEFVNTSDNSAPPSFKGVSIIGTDFTGSKGAIINPREVYDRDFTRTTCKDVIFDGEFDGVIVRETNFTGSKGAKINPRLVKQDSYSRGLYKTICTDVEITEITESYYINDSILDGCIYGKNIVENMLIKICRSYKDKNNNSPRKEIIKELKKYKGTDKIKLPFDSDFLRLFLFDGENFSSELEEEILTKLDFSNVDFSGFAAKGVDFSNYAGVTINLDTIKDKDISDANLSGAKIIGSFEGVNKTNTQLENASFEGNSFEDRFREKIKVLALQNQK